jgi:hypothetical protein
MPVQVRSAKRSLDGRTQHLHLRGRTTNVSDGGLLLAAEQPVRPRSRCAITLRDPRRGLAREVYGTVRWCRFDYSEWLIAIEIEDARPLAA